MAAYFLRSTPGILNDRRRADGRLAGRRVAGELTDVPLVRSAP